MSFMIGYHPPSLDTKSIDQLLDLGFRGWDRSSTFCSWLVARLQAEQIRRLQAENGKFLEVESFAVPLDWTNRELAEAMVVINAISFAVTTFEAGRFADKLVITMAAIIAGRLTEREAKHGCA